MKTNELNLRNGEKPNFDLDFGPFCSNLGQRNFIHGYYMY